jgi:hypothetical protein
MFSPRAAIAISILSFGCDGESRTTKPASGTQAEIRLEASDGLPRFIVQAKFDSNIDPGPHIQPVASALAVARGVCFAKGAPVQSGTLFALTIVVRKNRMEAKPYDPTGACLASAMDGKPIKDALDYGIELLVNVGS